jgi:hypothetical protein
MQATDHTGACHDRRAGVVIVTTADRGACPLISNIIGNTITEWAA